MIPLFFGAAKGYTTLVGVAVVTFTMSMKRMEIQMEELQLEAEELQAVPVPEVAPAEEGEKAEPGE